jgi:flagellar biosynthesis/type III secretory pathway M-ring protein FliF/YscJ
MDNWKVYFGRLLPFWMTVITSLWIIAFLIIWSTEKGYELYDKNLSQQVRWIS